MSALMKLNEYKLAAMRCSERTTQASLKPADNNTNNLQHRFAQVIAKSCRLHQLSFDIQQCSKGIKSEITILTEKLSETDQTRKALIEKQEIESLKKIVIEKSTNLENVNKV